MKPSFVIYILLVFIFTTCKKKTNEDPEYVAKPLGHPITCPPASQLITNPDMLACKFKAGTFWVFKDSVTGNIDTLLVKSLVDTSGTYGYNPCPSQYFKLSMIFRNDTGNVLISMKYHIWVDGFTLSSDFFWRVGSQPRALVYATGNADASYKLWDSLFIQDRYYKKVGESYAVQFTSTEYYNNPTRMYCQSMKSFFNTEFGFLRFDLFNRLTGQLTGRRKVIARNIIK